MLRNNQQFWGRKGPCFRDFSIVSSKNRTSKARFCKESPKITPFLRIKCKKSAWKYQKLDAFVYFNARTHLSAGCTASFLSRLKAFPVVDKQHTRGKRPFPTVRSIKNGFLLLLPAICGNKMKFLLLFPAVRGNKMRFLIPLPAVLSNKIRFLLALPAVLDPQTAFLE